jgi:hypothetical protein
MPRQEERQICGNRHTTIFYALISTGQEKGKLMKEGKIFS